MAHIWALGVDFTEKISFDQDGSGEFAFKVDLTKTSRLITLGRYLNNSLHTNVTQIIGYQPLCMAKEQLKSIPGLNHIHVNHGTKMLISKLKFRFKNIQALNKAMQLLNQGIDPPQVTYFSLSDELFVREDMNGIVKNLIVHQKIDNYLIKSLDLSCFFKGTTYTTIYIFPTRRIKDYSNPLSELSKNRKVIRAKHLVLAADEAVESIGNRIHFEEE